MSDSYGSNPYGPPGDQNPYGQQPEQPDQSTGGSNPYGTPGGNPYGAPGGSPYGSNPYGGPGGSPYGSADTTPPKTDGVSIAALITGFLCCFGFVGVILGIIGIRRTKNGERKGRGLAIAGIVVGAVMTVASVGIGGLIAWVAQNQISPDDAKVGQCMDIDHNGNSVSLMKKDCTDSHDGEILYVGEYTELEAVEKDPNLGGHIDLNSLKLNDSTTSYVLCSSLLDKSDLANIESDGTNYTWGIAQEDPNNPSAHDKFLCYIESGNGIDHDVLE